MGDRQSDVLNEHVKDMKKSLSDIHDFQKKVMQPSNNSTIISKMNQEFININKNLEKINETIADGFKDLVKAIEKSSK